MKIAIVVLSDIHFKIASGHPILARTEQIASAISTSDTEIEALLIVLAGDIANSGSQEEFDVAASFIAQLKHRLKGRLPTAKIIVAAVPGNHDCNLPEDAQDHRRSQVEASIRTVKTDDPDEYFLRDLLSPQEAFWKFANEHTDFIAEKVNEKIGSQKVVLIGSKNVQLNLMNSALLSQRHEDRGSLVLPVPLLKRAFSLDSNVDLSISILHHPPFWIEPPTMTALRQILNRVSDVVITGHEHFTSAFSQSQSTGEMVAFYESPAVYDSKFPQSSAFRVLMIDLDTNRQKEIGFRWKEGMYRNSLIGSQAEWKALTINRSPRYPFDMTTEQLRDLSDVGVAYVHPDTNKIRLSELFVYPDIRFDADAGKDALQIKGDKALNFLCESGVIVLQGGTFSGKTALSKSLCLEANALLGKVSVLLDGIEISNIDTEDFQKMLLKALKKQYRDADVDAYLQLLPEQRVVIVDNWHLARLTLDQRNRICKYLGIFASSSVLMVDELFKLRQIVTESTGVRMQIGDGSYRHGEIVGLSYVSRGRLINNWYRLRKDSIFNPPEQNNAAKVSEDQISSLLGKGNLPPYAFFILCMLQAQESKKLESIAGGSFGHYHEVLVITALTKSRSQVAQLDRKVAFCSEIAHYMWRKKIDIISRQQIDEVAESYLQDHLMSLQVDTLLADLEDARVLSLSEGHYRFSYIPFYFYFVARYIKEHFDGRHGVELRTAVDEMIDHISSYQNSTIIMFLIFFANERRHIIERLLHNASLIYEDVVPAKLEEDDAKAFIKRRDYLPPPSVTEHSDVSKNRENERVRKDANVANERSQMINADEVYGYSHDLPDQKKMHLAERTIDALGQVIRNFSATLPGDLKISVLQATYELGLRTMARVLSEVSRYLNAKSDELTSKDYSWELADSAMSITFLREEMGKLMLVMGKLISIHYCKKISSCVGVSDNELAYQKVMDSLSPSVAIKLVDITIQMEHSRTFPEAAVGTLLTELRPNPFAVGILQFLIALHLLVYKIDEPTRIRVAKLANLDAKKTEAASLKLLKET